MRVRSLRARAISFPRAHVPFGLHQVSCLGADQKARGLWERDWRTCDPGAERASACACKVKKSMACCFFFPNFVKFVRQLLILFILKWHAL